MDLHSQLRLLSSSASIEHSDDCTGAKPASSQEDLHIFPAVQAGGKRIRLLKTLLTSACEKNCYYCPFRAGRNMRRATFKPDEFARVFFDLHHKGIADGLFLSSGIIGGGVRTQQGLLDAAELLRKKFDFQGYLHLKLMPGVEKSQVERAMQLANRVSVNLEAPNPDRLARLAPVKDFTAELMEPLKWVQQIRSDHDPHAGWSHRWPSSVTQFVVGASDESDRELIETSIYLYRKLRLQRVYFSAFGPIPDTPLENKKATSPLREKRLYQASYLIRDYGYQYSELTFDSQGNLPLDVDPKLAWASEHLVERPVEINTADKQLLMRIPGIGLLTASRLIRVRRDRVIQDPGVLRKMGLNIERLSPYILLDGKRPESQLSLGM